MYVCSYDARTGKITTTKHFPLIKNRSIDLIIVVELTQLDVLQRPRESLDGSEVVLLQQQQQFTKEVRNKEKLKDQHSKFFHFN